MSLRLSVEVTPKYRSRTRILHSPNALTMIVGKGKVSDMYL